MGGGAWGFLPTDGAWGSGIMEKKNHNSNWNAAISQCIHDYKNTEFSVSKMYEAG